MDVAFGRERAATDGLPPTRFCFRPVADALVGGNVKPLDTRCGSLSVRVRRHVRPRPPAHGCAS